MEKYHISFWNLENLFAPQGYPAREPWIAKRMAKDLEGWSVELFERKIEQLAKIIVQMNNNTGTDLLGVCEVENRYCLAALADRLNEMLDNRNYRLVHADSSRDKRGIDTAFIYDSNRLLINENEIFSHFVMRRTGTRDITQCTFITNTGNEFVALCNHWPSRFGTSTTHSQGFRATAGETLAYWHMRIREEKTRDIPIIAFGDMNDDPADASVTIHARATRERDDVENSRSEIFYNLTWNYLRQNVTTISGTQRKIYGSLYYKGNANLFDQIFVNRAFVTGTGPFSVQEETTRLETFAQMTSKSKNEGPIRFGLPKGNVNKNINTNGYSDHFPVSVVIEENTITT